MAILTGRFPKSPAFPSGRYERTNPLRREAGVRLLAQPLPERLRWALIRAWRQPSRFEVGMTALPSLHRQRPGEALLAQTRPHLISFITLTEMEVSRRVVEAPQVSLKPEERNCLLAEQGEYLCLLYGALARQIGESAALAEFEWLLLSVGRARWRLRMPYKTLREGQPLLAAPATVLAHAPKDAAALLAAP